MQNSTTLFILSSSQITHSCFPKNFENIYMHDNLVGTPGP